MVPSLASKLLDDCACWIKFDELDNDARSSLSTQVNGRFWELELQLTVELAFPELNCSIPEPASDDWLRRLSTTFLPVCEAPWFACILDLISSKRGVVVSSWLAAQVGTII